jgi:hypothetical protein
MAASSTLGFTPPASLIPRQKSSAGWSGVGSGSRADEVAGGMHGDFFIFIGLMVWLWEGGCGLKTSRNRELWSKSGK